MLDRSTGQIALRAPSRPDEPVSANAFTNRAFVKTLSGF